jgi:hypothetical protein
MKINVENPKISPALKKRRSLASQGKRLTPNWFTYHDLGVQINNACVLPEGMSLAEIARRMGTTKQRMYHEYVVALGKLAFRLREMHPDWRSHD